MRTVFSWVIGVCLVFLAICPSCTPKEVDESTVAWVNEERIPFSIFWEEIKSRYDEAADPSLPEQEVLRSLKKGVLSDLIREAILLQEAARRGITISEKSLTAHEQDIKDGYTGSAFRKTLLTESREYGPWREALRKNMILNALFQEVVKEAKQITDQEVKDYYESNQDEFLVPETLYLRQIVVKDRSVAEKIGRKARKGHDFGKLAKQHSIGPEKEKEGYLGPFQKGELPEVMEKAAFSAPVGKVTSVVKTSYGYHLLKVDKRQPAHLASLDTVRERIARKLGQEKQNEYYAWWLDELVKNSDIRVRASLRDLVSNK